MIRDQIEALTDCFEGHAQKTACEFSGHPVVDHFVGADKKVDLGSGLRYSFGTCENVSKGIQ